MNNKKLLSLAIITALSLEQAAFAQSMGYGSMDMGSKNDMKKHSDESVSSISDDEDSSDDSDDSDGESSNGDVVVTGGEIHKGSYDVNGDLKIEGTLYVFGNLDVNGDITVEKNAKLRVTGKLSANGGLTNNGGSVYAGKKDTNGDGTNRARKLEAIAAEVDALLSADISAEEREAILADIADLKNVVRSGEADDLFDHVRSNIQKEDVPAFDKLVKKHLQAIVKRIKMNGGLTDKQLDMFVTKFESMTTEKLEAFVSKLDMVIKATKKKKFAFQVKQLRSAAESVLENRSVDNDAPKVEVPVAVPAPALTTPAVTASGSTATASGTTSTTSSGSTVSTGSGTTSVTASGTTSETSASGSTTATASGTTSTTSSGSELK